MCCKRGRKMGDEIRKCIGIVKDALQKLSNVLRNRNINHYQSVLNCSISDMADNTGHSPQKWVRNKNKYLHKNQEYRKKTQENRKHCTHN